MTVSGVAARADVHVDGFPVASRTGAVGPFVSPPAESVVSGGYIFDDIVGDGPLHNVYENISFTGMVIPSYHSSGRMLFRNCRITVSGNGLTDLYGFWLKHDERTPLVVLDRCTIQTPAPGQYMTTGIRNAYGAPALILGCKILYSQDGILGVASDSLIKDCYVEVGPVINDEHDDGIQVAGSSNLSIIHNTVIAPASNACLAMFTENGANTNLVVKNNLFVGGGYTVYAGDGTNYRASGLHYEDNVFWRRDFSNVGYFGPARDYNPAGGSTWLRNYFMDADGTLTSELVPQPGLAT